MKKTIVLIQIFICASCTPMLEREAQKLEGAWIIDSVQFFDGTNVYSNSGNLGQMIFDNKNSSHAEFGRQIIRDTVYNFSYDYSGEGYDYLDLKFSMKDKKTMPYEGIGRVQVYKVEFLNNRKKMIISADYEYDFKKDRKLSNVKYILTR